MKLLVTGGAGYIGSHFTKIALDLGHEVVVLDNLSTGYLDAVDKRAILHQVDLLDTDQLRNVISSDLDACIHFAAKSLVEESVIDPNLYYKNNIEGSRSLLEVLVEKGVQNIVFSSTAAIYGLQEASLLTEDLKEAPINPYGETKRNIEQMMHWFSSAYGMNYVSLRYFNVAGALPDGSLGERHNPETHLLPLILQVPKGKRTEIAIFGDDYPTEDGTCIRDYIHIVDLVDAHLRAVTFLKEQHKNEIINLGTSKGTSVLELIEEARRVTNHPIPSVVALRRAGDPAVLVADYKKAKDLLGWEPKYTKDIVKDAWNYFKHA